jgi:hypothetical protein
MLPPTSDQSQEHTALINDVNALMTSVLPGVPAMTSIVGLQQVSCSLFIALFERLMRIRLSGVFRTPTQPDQFVVNAEALLDAVNKLLPPGTGSLPAAVTAQALASGDIPAMAALTRVFSNMQRDASTAASVQADAVAKPTPAQTSDALQAELAELQLVRDRVTALRQWLAAGGESNPDDPMSQALYTIMQQTIADCADDPSAFSDMLTDR